MFDLYVIYILVLSQSYCCYAVKVTSLKNADYENVFRWKHFHTQSFVSELILPSFFRLLLFVACF